MTEPDRGPRPGSGLAAGHRWARAVASVGGCGFVSRAPGTVGSLAALPFGWALLHATPLLLLAIVVVSVGGIGAIRLASGGADHGWIVIDEVAGQWITLLGLAGVPGVAALHGIGLLVGTGIAFVLFRLLDIGKPGPIGWIDRRHDAFGVMGDDMLAGAIGAVLLLGARAALEWMR